jgi:flagellar basal-body rod protein FlgG
MSTRALRSAASGMYAQQLNIEVISNNIANINTNAFKKNKAEFQDLMYQEIPVNTLPSASNAASQSAVNKIQVGNGVQPTSTQKIFNQGDVLPTNNSMDLAIQGEGFFQVRKSDGSYAYTRDGAFKINSEGKLVTASGYYVDPEITMNEDSMELVVNKDGAVEVRQMDGSVVAVDNMQLVRFMNPGGLEAIGNNLYVETPASGNPIYGTPGANGFGEIQQGYLESSNVDIVEEMIAMIAAQRAYEINSKTVKTVEDMMTMANNLKRS